MNNKNWQIKGGILGFETSKGFSIPSVDEIYASVFENNCFGIISTDDVKELVNKFEFSKYPVDLNITLESKEDFSIELKIIASTELGDEAEVSWKNAADHIIIKNVWYPYSSGSMDDIFQLLKSYDIKAPGKITLRQYLSILKSSTNQIRNEVDLERFKLPETNVDEKPVGINAELYPYQTKGWQWLRFMKQEKIGGILADEMGLGKTLQIIALISSETYEDAFPSLIISPTTLLENWMREFSKFASHIKTIIHHGATRTGFPSELIQFNIVITSYETIVRDSSLFNQINWKLVICDEAQAIKNPATKRAMSVKVLSRQVGFAVTGTPIENRLTDLWSLMDFSVPEFLGDLASFERTYEDNEAGPAELETIISPLILRRKISEVAKDLPPKIIIPQVQILSEDEIEQYEHIREETTHEFVSNASLVVLIKLRMFCAHPFLISDLPNEDPAAYSNKYARLVEIVEEIVINKAKVLVFTSFNKMNDIIVSDLKKRFNIYSASIDGRTPPGDRQNIIDQFSNIKGAALLVLNPIAAGTGLNITAANHVIHYNLEWNPAKEDQASARAHRRGQDRPVTIHRLYYANTVEEAINERLTRKRQLAGTAIVGVQGDENDYADLLNAIRKSPKDR